MVINFKHIQVSKKLKRDKYEGKIKSNILRPFVDVNGFQFSYAYTYIVYVNPICFCLATKA